MGVVRCSPLQRTPTRHVVPKARLRPDVPPSPQGGGFATARASLDCDRQFLCSLACGSASGMTGGDESRRRTARTRVAAGWLASSAWASPRTSAAICARGSPCTGRRWRTRSAPSRTRSAAAGSCLASRLSRPRPLAVCSSRARPACRAPPATAAQRERAAARAVGRWTIGPSRLARAALSDGAMPARLIAASIAATSICIERAYRGRRPMSAARASYSRGETSASRIVPGGAPSGARSKCRRSRWRRRARSSPPIRRCSRSSGAPLIAARTCGRDRPRATSPGRPRSSARHRPRRCPPCAAAGRSTRPAAPHSRPIPARW